VDPVEARVRTNNTRRHALVGLIIDRWVITGQIQAFTRDANRKLPTVAEL
jgi:hypothetical protein